MQQVRSRAKDPASLRKKLEQRGVDLFGADDIEENIKDLAGCRIVFYTKGDVTKLINSGLISDNSNVLETKLHHPRRETEEAAELYISNHFLARLCEATRVRNGSTRSPRRRSRPETMSWTKSNVRLHRAALSWASSALWSGSRTSWRGCASGSRTETNASAPYRIQRARR